MADNVSRVAAFLEANFPHAYEIVIANNASTDRTLEIARCLAANLNRVSVLHSSEKGRGGAIKRAWQDSQADILSYMDVDLSTDLVAFPRLIEAVLSGGFHIAIGSRLLKGSQITRSVKREFISRCYNVLIRQVFHSRFSDAQCGFKAISRNAAAVIMPLVEDNGWFMDTELLVTAEHLGYSICDLPVCWVERPDTRVQLVTTAIQDLQGMLRICGRRRKTVCIQKSGGQP